MTTKFLSNDEMIEDVSNGNVLYVKLVNPEVNVCREALGISEARTKELSDYLLDNFSEAHAKCHLEYDRCIEDVDLICLLSDIILHPNELVWVTYLIAKSPELLTYLKLTI